MKYTYYRTCERCGAHLDPGEKCECRKTEDGKNFLLSERKGGAKNGDCKP